MRLRYAILRHEGVAEPHFDLLFESAPGSKLLAFRAEEWPIVGETAVVRLEDHRAIYLEYEGAISGNRGYVRRVEGGECEVTVRTPSRWVIELKGTGMRLEVEIGSENRGWCRVAE